MATASSTHADWMLLSLIGIVILVAIVGFFTTHRGTGADGLTGNVVADTSACGSCTGQPVCAVQHGKAVTYPSGCAAVCDGARVLADRPCDVL